MNIEDLYALIQPNIVQHLEDNSADALVIASACLTYLKDYAGYDAEGELPSALKVPAAFIISKLAAVKFSLQNGDEWLDEINRNFDIAFTQLEIYRRKNEITGTDIIYSKNFNYS